MEDLKTYIPGVGFLVTNLETGESHIFPEPGVEPLELPEPTEDEIAYDEAEAEAMARYEARYFEEGK